jgi:hypothetical protein
MFMDLSSVDTAPVTHPPVFSRSFLSRLAAVFRLPRRPLPAADLTDRQLADLNLRRTDVAQIDPRQVRLF